jgi:hypothetical protein
MKNWINATYYLLLDNAEVLISGLCILLVARFLWSDLFDTTASQKAAFCIIAGFIIVTYYLVAPVHFWR